MIKKERTKHLLRDKKNNVRGAVLEYSLYAHRAMWAIHATEFKLLQNFNFIIYTHVYIMLLHILVYAEDTKHTGKKNSEEEEKNVVETLVTQVSEQG